MAETIVTGSIGSSSPELSRFILDSDDVLESTMRRLQGFARETQPDGTWKYGFVSKNRYNKACLSWMRGKLEEIMDKNMYLSNITTEEMMYREARFIVVGFLDELYYNAKDFDLTIEKFEELRHLYSNRLHQVIRRPLNEGDKRFLKETTQESTQRLQQTISEQQVKKGIMGRLFGG